MTTFSLVQLQQEQKPWVLHNFGERPASQPLRGITEELGELMEAFFANDLEGIRDSLADCAIFIVDYCTASGVRMTSVILESSQLLSHVKQTWTGTSLDAQALLAVVGSLNHHDLKKEQGIRVNEDHDGGIVTQLASLINFLRAACRLYGNDATLEALVEQVWSKVKLRDWKNNVGASEEPTL